MRAFFRYILPAGLFLFVGCRAFGQPSSFRFTHLTIDDGLSQGAVGSIVQDSKGYMWFSTKDGLNRYDGYRFTIFRNDPSDSTSLSASETGLHVDRSGRLWIATPRKLNLYDPATERFRHIDLRDNRKGSGNSEENVIHSFCDGDDGTLWVGTGDGLVRYNPADGSIRRYRNDPGDPASLGGNFVRTVLRDCEGELWIATLNGLDRAAAPVPRTRHGATRPEWTPRFTHYTKGLGGVHGLSDDLVASIFESRDSVIWLGTHSGLYRLNRAERAAGKFRLFPHVAGAYSEPWMTRITSMCEDLQGRIWFATPEHLGIFDPRTERYTYLSHDPLDPGSIGCTGSLSLWADRTGKIWVGSNGKGIDIHDQNARRFFTFSGFADRPPYRSSMSVRSVVEDSDGSVWFSLDHMLYRYYPRSGACDSIHSRGVILDLLRDSRNALWVATSTGLLWYPAANPARRGVPIPPPGVKTFPRESARHLLEDHAGNIWCIAADKLTRFDPGRKRFETYLPWPGIANEITCFREGRAGEFWIGSSGSGLMRFEPAGGRRQFYRHSPTDTTSLGTDNITCLCPDFREPDRTLWIGTAGNGISRLDIPSGRITRITEKQGLANNYIYGILPDEENRLWISTNRGLCRFDPRQTGRGAFHTYLAKDGLQSNEFNTDSYCKARDGSMIFGGVNGITWFVPSEIRDNPFVPPIVFTDFTILGRPVQIGIPGSPLRKHIGVTDTLVLPARENVFAFEFAALDFTQQGKNLYAYKMEGFHQEWVQAGTHRIATFTNLDPGEYIFRVRGSNGDGVWNEKGASLLIVILHPWWRTWPAYGAYLFLFAVGVFVIDRIQRRRTILKERAHARIQEAELRALAAESQSKALQAENERRRLELSQAEELARIDDIVRAINMEFDLERLVQALLQHGMKLLPNAQKSSALLLDQETREFAFVAAIGYDLTLLRTIKFPAEEIILRYTEASVEVGHGVYILKHLTDLPGEEKLQAVPRSAALLIMAIEWVGLLRGYLVFDNLTNSEAFDETDARRLQLFQEHAVAAIAKAESLHILQEKNEEILRTQEQLIMQEKLASLGALTAGIAHEIKNPLNFINNFSEFSLDLAGELREELRRHRDAIGATSFEAIEEILAELELYAGKIHEHGSRADSIVRSMLQHSRAKPGERQMTDINALLEENLNLAYHGMRAQDSGFTITIERDFAPDLVKLPVVSQDISRVFLNVITNGFYAAYRKKKDDFPSAPGFIPTLSLRTRNIGEGVEVRIRDNGTGIPPALHKKMFTPFFTTKPAGQGTGLGLSLSHDIIVKGHRGEIAFETEEGQYTEFIITLPKQEAVQPQWT